MITFLSLKEAPTAHFHKDNIHHRSFSSHVKKRLLRISTICYDSTNYLGSLVAALDSAARFLCLEGK
jgi:hypothetical protein